MASRDKSSEWTVSISNLSFNPGPFSSPSSLLCPAAMLRPLFTTGSASSKEGRGVEERDCERDHGERESNERKQVSAPPCLSGLAAQWLAGCIYQSTWHFPSQETVSRDLDRCAPPNAHADGSETAVPTVPALWDGWGAGNSGGRTERDSSHWSHISHMYYVPIV